MSIYMADTLFTCRRINCLTWKPKQHLLHRRAGVTLKASKDSGEEFLQNFKALAHERSDSTGALDVGTDASDSSEVTKQTPLTTVSTGGCGCKGSSSEGGPCSKHGQEEAMAQGVISSFSSMVGGPDGRLSREDLAQAFNTPVGEGRLGSTPGEGTGSAERFWDAQEVLEGAPSDLVFWEEDEMIV